MRVVFAGTPQVALPSLRAFLDSSHEVAAVITRPDARAGRGRRSDRMEFSPVKQLALEHGVEVLQPDRLRDPATLDRLREIAPDCCPVVAYGGLIPPAALAIARLGWVNLHFSLLPAWRGAAPVQHAVMAGDDVTGATVFMVEQALDTGPVIATMTQGIGPRDTAGDLLDRLADAGAGLLVAAVNALGDGTAHPVPQPADGVSLAPKVTTDDARVRFDRPAFAVDRQIRGCTPNPGAWASWRGERVKLGPLAFDADQATLSEQPGTAALGPGQVQVTRRAVLVGTATHPVTLGQVQAAGKKPMPATDWARGIRVAPGERFGPDAAPADG